MKYLIACFFLLFALQQGHGQVVNKTLPTTALQDTIPRENVKGVFENKSQPVEQIVRNSADLEVDGLIVDETITKVGRDFYHVFSMQWEAPVTAKNFTILIKEKPTRGNGALITVTLNETTVFEQNMQPRYDVIEQLATYAVGVVYESLLNDQMSRQLEAEGRKARELF